MKGTQYCRYCAFCIEGDSVYCTNYDTLMTEKAAKQVNHCKAFALSDAGDIFTGRKYVPRKSKPIEPDVIGQMIISEDER